MRLCKKIREGVHPLDNRPIGIFDSGLGGLTAYAVLRRELPGENMIFFGDSGRAPYGGREREQLIHMGKQNMQLLADRGVKAVVIACGTISSTALAQLRRLWPEIAIRGVVEDAARETAQRSASGRVGVIATRASIQSGAFAAAIRRCRPESHITAVACPGFVPLIEAGRFGPDAPEAKQVVERELEEIRRAAVDTLLLGCTHFPLLAPQISAYLGESTVLIDSGAEAARAMARELRENDLLANREKGSTQFLVSGDPEAFAASARNFLGEDIRADVTGLPPMPL